MRDDWYLLLLRAPWRSLPNNRQSNGILHSHLHLKERRGAILPSLISLMTLAEDMLRALCRPGVSGKQSDKHVSGFWPRTATRSELAQPPPCPLSSFPATNALCNRGNCAPEAEGR